jgi:hypothetical protein
MTKPSVPLQIVKRLTEAEIQMETYQERRLKWSSGSDVQKTWRKFGWLPPSETKFAHIGEELLPQNNT